MAIIQKCQLCKNDFTITDADLAFYKRIDVPVPKLCPDDRQRRRTAFRNERNFYTRKCDGTGRQIVSMYSPDKPFKVYDQEFFWGDDWSALDYGQDYDPNRPFFEQFRELQLKVPRISLFNYQSENSYYTNHSGGNKNCYMGVDLGGCEDVYYSYWLTHCKDCIDCSYTYDCELCYQCLYCKNCFNCDFCHKCEQSTDCRFCFDCRGCQNCFGSAGLRNKKYHIFNKGVGKEEYEAFVKTYEGSYHAQQKALEQSKEIQEMLPHRFAHIINSENCIGDQIYNSKNATNCFNVVNVWDCKYCYNTLDTKDSYDCYQPGFEDSELIYEIHGGNTFFNCKFLNVCRNLRDCEYCDNCFDSQDLFGCVSVKRGQYRILNKQYKKEEYFVLRAQIIKDMSKTGEYGEFFPFSCSPFGYNESKAQEYYPLSRGEALRLGMNWSDYEAPAMEGAKISIPDNIQDVDEKILDKVLICEKTGRPFKIIKQEYLFYKRKHLPVPHKHPIQRYKERMQLENPKHLFDRECDRCQQSLRTTFSPGTPEKVYCEKCYLENVQ